MKKHLKVTINAPIVLGFSLACLIATILGLVSGGTVRHLLFSTYRRPLTSILMYVRLFTHVLGHTSISHLMGNMAYILLLGPILEEKYGSKNFLEMICITACITGIIHNIFFPKIMLLGASGIVFMCIILASAVSFKGGEIPITLILVFVIYVGGEIMDAVSKKDNISQLGHIIGGFCGGAYGMMYANMPSGSKK